MKYYVYGGAFNPPTIAHQQITEKLVSYAGGSSSGVILLPSGNRSDKTISTPLETRLKLLQAMITDVNSGETPVSIETMELYRGYEVQTFDTVKEMKEKWVHDEFVWVFGSDSFNSMPNWDHGEWMVENLSILIIERPGYPVNPLLYSHQEKIYVDSISDTSSTELREKILSGSEYRHIVGKNVYSVLQGI